MPELPEVETFRRGLVACVKGKTIAEIQVSWPKIVVGAADLDRTAWADRLIGQAILDIGRRGKYLIFYLSQDVLIAHLRMEGKFLYYETRPDLSERDIKHTHLKFIFQDASELHYHDVRKFGRIERIDPEAVPDYFRQRQLGPEPTPADFHLDDFQVYLRRRQRPIKPLLLDQKAVVGLGNIYVDEALFQARIHPARPSASLQPAEVQALHQAIIDVLDRAVEAGGSTIRTYHNNLGQAGSFQLQLAVYGQQGKPCPRCGTPIEKIQFQQRGTHFCPHCQPLEGERL